MAQGSTFYATLFRWAVDPYGNHNGLFEAVG